MKHPWPEVNLVAVAHRAGMTVREFTRHYPDLVSCLVDALEESLAACYTACAAVCSPALSCRRQFDAIVGAVVSWVVTEPAMARLVFVVAEEPGLPVLHALRAAAIPRFVGLFHGLTERLPAGSTQAEFVIGSIYRMLNKALTEPQDDADRSLADARRHARELALFIGVHS